MARNLSIFNSDKLPSGVIWMLFFFLLLEISARLLWHPHIVGQRIYTRFDPSYNYGFDPSHPPWFEKEDTISFIPTQYLNIHCQTLPRKKKDNEFRIFTFGGSVSRGEAVGNYSFLLQKYLNAFMRERQWNIINLSADGIGSKRILQLFEKIMPLKPDMVVLHVHGSNEYEDERDENYRKDLHLGMNGLLFQSYTVVLLKKIYNHISGYEGVALSDAKDERIANQEQSNQRRWLETIDHNTAKMVAYCKKINVPLIIVGRAEKMEGFLGFNSRRTLMINNKLRTHSTASITYFDTAKHFYESFPLPRGKELLFSDETHWTEYGHRVIAQQLYNLIIGSMPNIVGLLNNMLASTDKRGEKRDSDEIMRFNPSAGESQDQQIMLPPCLPHG